MRVNTGPEGEYGELLKGSHVTAARKRAIGGVILQVREAPRSFTDPFIVDFDCPILPGIKSWSCNQTNARKLAALISPETDEWNGWGIVLVVVRVENPKTGREVDSLSVLSATEPKKTAKTRKTKPVLTAQPQGPAEVNLDDVPF